MTLLDAMVESSDGLRQRETAPARPSSPSSPMAPSSPTAIPRMSCRRQEGTGRAPPHHHRPVLQRTRITADGSASSSRSGAGRNRRQQLSMLAPNGLAASLEKIARELDVAVTRWCTPDRESLVPPETWRSRRRVRASRCGALRRVRRRGRERDVTRVLIGPSPCSWPHSRERLPHSRNRPVSAAGSIG